MSSIIEFRNVSKAYRLGESTRSLREAISELGRMAFLKRQNKGNSILWALRDLSFRVGAGEALGIIGPNGAGKTTILKLLSNITQCTRGELLVDGRVSSLIELGAGFHPDLTGRENIYLNGAILGMTRRQTRERFDQIVDFSGLSDFLDTPVKRYSSGMYARLGFSVAAHTGAAILLVDEVLAVGDIGFQAKSVRRMRELVDGGATVVFVSHSLYYVNHFCDRVILLNKGEIQESGRPHDVIRAYQELMQDRLAEDTVLASQGQTDSLKPESSARIASVQILDINANSRDRFEPGESLILRVVIHANQPIKSPVLEFVLASQEGVVCYKTHNRTDGVTFPDVCGEFEVRIEFPELRLLPNAYSVSVRLFESGAIGIYDRKEAVRTFKVVHPRSSCGVENGLFYLPHHWKTTQEITDDSAESHRSNTSL